MECMTLAEMFATTFFFRKTHALLYFLHSLRPISVFWRVRKNLLTRRFEQVRSLSTIEGNQGPNLYDKRLYHNLFSETRREVKWLHAYKKLDPCDSAQVS